MRQAFPTAQHASEQDHHAERAGHRERVDDDLRDFRNLDLGACFHLVAAAKKRRCQTEQRRVEHGREHRCGARLGKFAKLLAEKLQAIAHPRAKPRDHTR